MHYDPSSLRSSKTSQNNAVHCGLGTLRKPMPAGENFVISAYAA
jgi:hypothetical protein